MLDWAIKLVARLLGQVNDSADRFQRIDYTVCRLPENILAVVRLSWYKDGKAHEIDEFLLMEDGQNGYDAFHHMVQNALSTGADVYIRSGYDPEDLGLSP